MTQQTKNAENTEKTEHAPHGKHRADPADLQELTSGLDYAYLLSASSEGAPRALAVHAAYEDGDVLIAKVSRRTLTNVDEHPEVSLVWPPVESGGRSLIVDGTARSDGDTVRVTPTSAVWHRPAPPAGEDATDC